MKLSVKLALLSASAALLVTSAFAETVLVDTTSKNSVYVSGEAGYGALSVPNKNIEVADGFFIKSASHSNDGFAGGANVGLNHALNHNVLVGAEFGYDYNTPAKYTENASTPATQGQDVQNDSLTMKVSSWNLHLLATGTYLFNNGINVFAKAGGARVEQKTSCSESSGDAISNINDTQYQPMLAAGLGYRIKMVDIYAQYSHTFGKNANDFDDLFNSNGTVNVVSVDTIKAGIAYNIAI